MGNNIELYPSSVLGSYSILELAKYAKRYSNINLTILRDYYINWETKKYFEHVYNGLDELDYLRHNLSLLI